MPHTKKQNINFLEIEKPKYFSKFIIFVFLLVLLFIGVAFAFGTTSNIIITQKKESSDNIGNQQIFLFILGFLVSFVGNLLSDLVWKIWLDKRISIKEPKKINAIAEIAERDLTNAILTDLKELKGVYCDYLDIKMTLSCIEDTSLVKCSVIYKYKKNLSPNITCLDFHFVRLKNAEDKKFRDDIKDYETVDFTTFSFDEESLTSKDREFLNSQKDSYVVNYVKVNDKIATLTNSPKNPPTWIPETVSYSANGFTHDGGKAEIEFEIGFYLESESYFSFKIDEPTKNLHCILSYAKAEKLNIYSEHSISANHKGQEKNLNNHQQIEYTLTDTWIYPRSKLQFIWYENL